MNSLLFRPYPTWTRIQCANLTEALKDLTSSTFHVPIVDKHRPIAYRVINEVHLHHDVAKHSGVETYSVIQ